VASGLPESSEAEVASEVIETDAQRLGQRSRLIARIVVTFRAWNEKVKRATRNMLDLRLLIILPFGLHSLFFRKKDLFFWILLGLFAIHAVINLTQPRVATA
jgi:hypothetical protein